MDSKTGVNFRQPKGYFVPRWALVGAGVAAALALLVVGLLVGYLAPCHAKTGSGSGETDDVSKPLPYVRLPRSVVPDHYDVELQPFIFPDNFTFEGKVRVVIRVLEPTNNVTLHINNVTVREASVRLSGPDAPGVASMSEDKERQFYILHLKSDLVAGRQYEVQMDYLGTLNDQLAGFYRSSYKDDAGQTRWLATTQFQPTDARRAFPCFDEPGLKATFNITLVRPDNMTSLSNMPLIDSKPRGEGWIADRFQTTVRMSTYLLAFVVSDFKSRGTEKFSVWSREAVIDTTAYALQVGPAILSFYETFFKVKYPLPKTDMIAIPDFSAGAMENWGLITYRETALLFDPRFSSSSNRQRVATVISHELAHQWFGNLVTPQWWDDLWLNEGFASYVEYLGVEAVHPDWQMDQQFVLDEVHDVMDLDCLKTSHPISLPVRHPDEINEIFDRISYGKGASIIRMMKYFLGDDNFKNGLMNYLNDKKFGNAVQDDLWKHLTDIQSNGGERIDVKKVMDSWTLQMGYPVVSVVRNYAAGTATVQQSRFLLEPNPESTDASSWEIPFTYTDGLNPDWNPKTKMWLHKTNGSLKGLPSRDYWVVANIQEVGYYRVNYDEHNWRLLIQQFQQDHKKIHPVNRAQIIDDSLDLARAGLMDYQLALNTTLYLRKEEDYLPWKAALHGFSFIDSMICRSAVYGKWKEYVVEQLKRTYDQLGWEESPDENILTQFKRVSVLSWMCVYGHEDCIQKAQERFNRWRQDPDNVNIVPPNLRSVVYCTAVSHGGEDVWNFLWARYKAAKIASEKDKFMYSLACAREPWLLTRYLNWSLTSESGIRRQDGSYVFRSVGAKLYGRDLTFNYIRDKWDVIFKRYGKSFFAISGMLKSVTSSLNTQFELFQLKEFYAKHKNNLGTAKRAFQQSLENAEANVRWMDTNYAHIVQWLDTAK
ncbi:aminopeptidase N [Nephila pilipes]|uniref:Aminopeptidase n=1 Tax=Nephila pilipes TaxID=299642 RepID=A0A8X6NFK8_NEPPI|nr:aminopeptidase N [Nephila pilipes]GFT12416.1 aminopeptidase N [Nephila pilipes]GFT12418.1 aminopeptidase N [Nephila pilipes]